MAKEEKRLVLYLVGANCNDPAQESEFNRWYNEVHIPEVLRLPGFVSARRYEIIKPREGYPKYMAVYEMQDEAAYNAFQEYMRKARKGEAPAFTAGPEFAVPWTAGYKPI
ncbi:MAG: DUF4286 family protein [Chloroflexi bacterium]|nr:DUF4286 family protein [Chloroflexota bacterium]